MKITEMRVTPIAVGDPPLLNAAGLHAPYALRTIVELVSDDGITGLGEIPGASATLADFTDSMHALIEDPRLLQDNLIRQLYHMGQSLEQKYRLVRLAYTLFILGVGGAGSLLAVLLLMRNVGSAA